MQITKNRRWNKKQRKKKSGNERDGGKEENWAEIFLTGWINWIYAGESKNK